MAKTRAVIFDLDGTLFDHDARARAGLAAVMDRFEIVENPDDVFTRHAQLTGQFEAAVLAGELDPAQGRTLRFARLLEELGVPDATGHGKAAAKTYSAGYDATAALLPNALEVLGALRDRGLKIVVLTNFLRSVQKPKLRDFGLAPLVDALLCIEDVPEPKPAPGAFHAACRAVDVEPKSAVMVGDSIRVDVSGALDAGLKAIWFAPGRRDLALAREITTVSALTQIPDLL